MLPRMLTRLFSPSLSFFQSNPVTNLCCSVPPSSPWWTLHLLSLDLERRESSEKYHFCLVQKKLHWTFEDFPLATKSLFEIISKQIYPALIRTQRSWYINLWHIVTWYIQYLWVSWFGNNISQKCHLWNKSNLSDDFAKKARTCLLWPMFALFQAFYSASKSLP